MSHLVKATCDVTDFSILKRVCDQLGYINYTISDLPDGRQSFKLPHSWHNLVFFSDGQVECDDMDMHRLDRIKQAYATMIITDLASMSGMQIEQSTTKTGEIVLVLTKLGER